MKKFSENLKRLMAKSGLNQVELARISGVRQQYISRYLNEDPCGKSPRDLETLIALCEALECSLYELTGIEALKKKKGKLLGQYRLSAKALEIAKAYDNLTENDTRRNSIRRLLQKSDQDKR